MKKRRAFAKPYSVVILGLGKIGCGYDANAPASVVFTHARAFTRHPGFRVIAGVDPSPAARAVFTKVTGAPAFARLADAGLERCDVVAAAVPTAAHLEGVREALSLDPRLIVLEKPVAASLSEALRIRALVSRRRVPCCVNYIRRFDPGMTKLAGLVRGGRLGALQAGHCFYSKGLFNGASHYVDLLQFLLGPGEARAARRSLPPYGKCDPQPSFTLDFGGAGVSFAPVDWRRFDVGEVDLFFTKGRVRLKDLAETVEIFETQPDPHFRGHVRLAPAACRIRTDMKRYQLNVAERLHAFLARGAKLPSTLDTGLATMRLCAEAARRAGERG